jgi:hypothetical protein
MQSRCSYSCSISTLFRAGFPYKNRPAVPETQ